VAKLNRDELARFHQEACVVDGHCDTVSLLDVGEYDFARQNDIGHVDLPRLQAGGVNVQVFALYQEPRFKPVGAMKRTLVLLNKFTKEVENNIDQITLVKDYQEIEEAYRQGKIAAILSIEGGDALEGDAEVLEVFHALGVRALGLTWNNRNCLADGVGEDLAGGGLTSLGREVVKLCGRKNILIDLAHISKKGFTDTVNLAAGPIIVSHANAWKLCPHKRNLTDEQLKLIRDLGGVVGVTFYPPFVKESRATMEDLLNHFAYMAELIGTDYIGIGSDFDGIDETLAPLTDVSKMPLLTEGLLAKGFTKEEVVKILGLNFLRVLKQTLSGGSV
jgi:membrane dipeptidase